MSEHIYNHLKAEASARKTANPERDASPQNSHDELIRLQRTLGNQGVQRLLAQRQINPAGGTLIQAKLAVTPANDQYEQEADQVAKQVVSQPETVQREEGAEAEEEELMQAKRLDIQRQEGAEAEEEELMQAKRLDIQRQEGAEAEEEELMQAKRLDIQRSGGEGGFEVGGALEDEIHAQRGGGQSMDGQARGFFEQRMGHDFSNVQIHQNGESDVLNRALNARAFTIGSDIFFRQGEYQPETQSGKELLAHELTHVVQQGSAVQKKEAEE